MILDDYVQLTRYFTTFVFSFFTYQFIVSIVNFKNHQDKSSLWHTLMCFSTAMYCFVFAFNTHFFNQLLSNTLLGVFWICAYSSFFCYLKAIEGFINAKIKFLAIPKIYCLFLCLVHLINIITSLCFDWNFLFYENFNQVTLFAKTMSFTISPSIGTLGLGAVGALMVIFSGITIWRELNKRGKDEPILKMGILLTIFSVLNDSALGLELTGALIPLYYIGNAFEALRFNLYYQRLAYKKINTLEAEVDELSKIAQFGTAAASISHDIKNYLMIIQFSLKHALKGRDVEGNIEKSLKYIDQSGKVTKLYMDLFKHSSEIPLAPHSLKSMVHNAYEMLEIKLNKQNIEFKTDIPEDLDIKCNDIAFTLALVNLVSNAIDVVSKHDNPWIKILYSTEKNIIEVIDSGEGIPKGIADKIFDFNFSTKKDFGGSGLGLSITKQIIEKCGLTVFLDETKENTTFVIKLS